MKTYKRYARSRALENPKANCSGVGKFALCGGASVTLVGSQPQAGQVSS